MNTTTELNQSGIRPKGHRVLVLPHEVPETNEMGIILSSTAEKERKELAQCYGTVVEVGPEAWPGKNGQPREPWAKAGDQIIYAKYAGLIFPGADKNQYRLINDSDIVATFDAAPKDTIQPRIPLTAVG